METENITLSLPRTLLRKATVVAAKRQVSVSALVARTLEDLVRQDDEDDVAIERALARARRGFDLGTRGAIPFSRSDLHAR